MSKLLAITPLLVTLFGAGCALTVNGETSTIGPKGMTKNSPDPNQGTPKASPQAEAQKTSAEDEKRNAAREAAKKEQEEQDKKRAEQKALEAEQRALLEQKAKTTTDIAIDTLGVSVPFVPGDATAQPGKLAGRVTPIYVSGPISGGALELADAVGDTSSLEQRIQRETSNMKGVHIIKKGPIAGGYAFEFVWRADFVDGNGFHTGSKNYTGYFAKRAVGKRTVHCYLFQGNEVSTREVEKRCTGMKPL